MRISEWPKARYPQWYLGARCKKCRSQILFALDRAQGESRVLFLTRGSTRKCFNSFDSGNPPCCWREKMTSRSNRTSNTASLPGINATSPTSFSNVVKSSCATHAARRSQRHCEAVFDFYSWCHGLLRSSHYDCASSCGVRGRAILFFPSALDRSCHLLRDRSALCKKPSASI